MIDDWKNFIADYRIIFRTIFFATKKTNEVDENLN
jgi:hypothetical protein